MEIYRNSVYILLLARANCITLEHFSLITANWLAEEKIQYFSDNVLGQINHLQKEFWKSVQ